ncbi:MAG: hypothetical protein ACM3XN_03665 [Chloroflexota bacterium]
MDITARKAYAVYRSRHGLLGSEAVLAIRVEYRTKLAPRGEARSIVRMPPAM